MSTKKVGSTGRFGPRYGRKIKIRVRDIEAVAKAKHPCPRCKSPKSVKRVCAGIWLCSTCGIKFAGGAHTPVPKREKKEEIKSVEEYEDKLDTESSTPEASSSEPQASSNDKEEK